MGVLRQVTEANDKPVKTKSDTEKSAKDNPVVVIIDDEPATVQVLDLFLKIKGFKPIPALTGAAGLKAIAEQSPSAVILDLMLPDIDGYEICRQLRADKKTATLPIIMLSARVHRDDVKRGYAAGATRYLKKPVDLDTLAAEVRRVVELAQHEAPPPGIQDKDATGPATGGK